MLTSFLVPASDRSRTQPRNSLLDLKLQVLKQYAERPRCCRLEDVLLGLIPKSVIKNRVSKILAGPREPKYYRRLSDTTTCTLYRRRYQSGLFKQLSVVGKIGPGNALDRSNDVRSGPNCKDNFSNYIHVAVHTSPLRELKFCNRKAYPTTPFMVAATMAVKVPIKMAHRRSERFERISSRAKYPLAVTNTFSSPRPPPE